ncbi:MAG: YgaP-like transmembrane domain [Candidatus Acidiferrales bacterium]
MSFTPNIGPVTRAVYIAFGAALLGVAWWGPLESVLVSLALTAVGAVVAFEGAIGF